MPVDCLEGGGKIWGMLKLLIGYCITHYLSIQLNVIIHVTRSRCLPGTFSSASSARVGNKSTNSTRASDTIPEPPWSLLSVIPGTWIIRGTFVVPLKLLYFDHS